jgi:hypothetical protein
MRKQAPAVVGRGEHKKKLGPALQGGHLRGPLIIIFLIKIFTPFFGAQKSF